MIENRLHPAYWDRLSESHRSALARLLIANEWGPLNRLQVETPDRVSRNQANISQSINRKSIRLICSMKATEAFARDVLSSADELNGRSFQSIRSFCKSHSPGRSRLFPRLKAIESVVVWFCFCPGDEQTGWADCKQIFVLVKNWSPRLFIALSSEYDRCQTLLDNCFARPRHLPSVPVCHKTWNKTLHALLWFVWNSNDGGRRPTVSRGCPQPTFQGREQTIRLLMWSYPWVH